MPYRKLAGARDHVSIAAGPNADRKAENRARELMCELFGLDENHNGISIPSTVNPGYSFEFYIGGVMRFVMPDRERTVDRSADLEFCEPYGFPPTDIAISGALYALANETDYVRRTNMIKMREWVTDPN